ncbi:S-layer homology domain-containing protein [Pseudarthrobacter polychromogenes]|uniref:S-layer homology domain-containing protein n=2 Tax=Pseudarthrobacter polychromogenes TaxID=1676 RepID=UPI0031D8F84C
MSAHATDDQSGVASVFVALESDESAQNAYATLYLSSGTPKDGIFVGSVTLPQGAASGTWTPRMAFLKDAVGNDSGSVAFRDITPPKLTVFSALQDTSAPVLVDFSLSPEVVDVGAGPQEVTMSAHATDDQSGVASVFVALESDESAQNAYATLYLSSGTPKDGIFVGSVTLPQGAASGTWTPRMAFLKDAVGNDSGSVAFRDITPPKLTVFSALQDTSAPVLVDFSLSPEVVDVGAGPQEVTMSAHATDDQSGVASVFVALESDESAQNAYATLYLSSGTPKDGIFVGSVTLPQGAASGTWTPRMAFLKDAVGNDSGSVAFRDITPPKLTVSLDIKKIAPPEVVFYDGPGSDGDRFEVPDEPGVDYFINSLPVEPGTYPGVGLVTVSAAAAVGFALAEGAITSWTHTFESDLATMWRPVSLVEFARSSGDVLQVGDVVSFDWAVEDASLEYMEVTLVDALGRQHYLSGGGGFSGTLSTTVDDWWAPGAVEIDRILVKNATSSVYYDADGGVHPNPPGMEAPRPFSLDVQATRFSVQNDVASWRPVSLVEFARSSGDVLQVGDVVSFDWAVEDASLEYMEVTLVDALGRQHYLSGGGGFSGTLSTTVDDWWAPGAVEIDRILVKNATSSVYYDADGGVHPNPPGMEAPRPFSLDVQATRFSVQNDVASWRPVSLVEFARSSGDVLQVGDVVSFDWAVEDASLEYMEVTLVDALGRQHYLSGGGGFSGTLSTTVDDWWAPGAVEIDRILVKNATSSVYYDADGGVHPNPPGMEAPRPFSLDVQATRFAVEAWRTTPKGVTFADEDGTAEDTFTVPVSEGVEYLVGDTVTAAGTYPGSGTVSVTARAVTDYVLAPGASAEWSHSFKETPYQVIPAVVVFTDEDGTVRDTFTVPVSEGVEYLVGDKLTAAGTYPGSGTIAVTARAKTDYVLAPGASAEWSHSFKETPYQVIPAVVVFTDEDGTVRDTFTVPVSEGVEYLVGDKLTAAGTYPGSGTIAVTARAKTDYVLAPGAAAEWSHSFKETPYQVTPDAVSFTEKDGTAGDTFTIPVTEGVEYLVGDKVMVAGTYPGSGTIAVIAHAKADYVLAEGASAEWSHEFKATPYPVTPAAVVFMDEDGTAGDKFTVPVTEGVEYLVGDKVTAAGTYPGSGTIAVIARAKADYVLAEGASAEWSHEFKATPYAVTPAAVVFTDEDGTAKDTYTVPATEGVEYVVGDEVTAAGTYPGSGKVVVRARALDDYVLAEGAAAEWSHEFKVTPYAVTPAAVVFTDEDGTAKDTYTVPATEGVEYVVGDNATAAGTYPGTGTVQVTARALADFVLAQGAAAEWSHEFKVTPHKVTAAGVVFSDLDGTKDDSFTVPVSEGVEYLVGGEVTAPGAYRGSGTVTVTARAVTDYVLAPGAAAEWSHEFKATPYQVTPAAVIFTDEDGTAQDTYTVPATEGVEYLVGDKSTAAGTYPGSGTVTVTARAKTDYVLAPGASAEWSREFKATPYQVTPAAVIFSDKDGTAQDTYTVPVTEGVEYLVGDKVTAAGTYPGSGTVTVTARAKTDYVLAPGASAEWSREFKATPYQVTPAAVIFSDKDGTTQDTYTVPVTEGVEYLVGDKVTAAGTYPGSGTVTVTARAKTDYVLAPGASAEWSHEFKATPFPVTPAAVVFMDKDGTAEDTFTVPVTEGVEYLVGDKSTAAGTYPGSGTVTVTARAKTDYVLAPGASAEWSHEFKATPFPVTPAAVVFMDKDSTAEDTFTVPVTEGVEYLVGDKVTAAGTYPGSGTVTVTARAKTDYVLAPGASAEWLHEFKATPYPVDPAAVVFTDQDGTKDDTFTVPVTEGVEYLVGDKVTAAGTYPGTGTIAVTARAKTDYVLAEGAVTEWSYTFKTTSAAYVPPAVSPFVDVSTGQQFYREMAWLAERKISTGWDEGNGVRAYRPLQAINRDAMAAFLYRMAGSPEYAAPAVSPFEDVSTGQQFYKEMAWLAEQKISTGWDEGNGVRTYRPLQAINRDAMAAFLYRMAGSPEYAVPAVSPFADVSTGQQFYKEMAWLAEQKISTGWDEGNSVRTYRPLQAINRDAMAAFLFRLDGLTA